MSFKPHMNVNLIVEGSNCQNSPKMYLMNVQCKMASCMHDAILHWTFINISALASVRLALVQVALQNSSVAHGNTKNADSLVKH